MSVCALLGFCMCGVFGGFFWLFCFCENAAENRIWTLQQVTKRIAHFKENPLDCNKEKNK